MKMSLICFSLLLVTFFMACSKSTNQVVSFTPTEKVAVINLYNLAGGNNWVNKTNWFNYSAPYWKGIAFNTPNTNSLIGIDLSANNLTGVLTPMIGNFTQLNYLALYGNPNLIGNLPISIGNLTNLKTLYINDCGFTGPIPDTIASLSNLIGGDLSNNNFDTANSSVRVKTFLNSVGISFQPRKPTL